MKTKAPVSPEVQQKLDALKSELSTMPLSDIARTVRRDWQNMNFAAVPYFNAMMCMNSVDDNYGADSGKSVVAYFLGNAQTWRGETAKLVKAELNRRIK